MSFKIALATVITALLASGCSAPESPKGIDPKAEAKPAVDAAAIQAEVEAAMKDYGKAITSGDIEGTLDGLTDDVHILQANRNQKGKDVKDMFRGLLTAYKVVEFDLRPIEFFAQSNDVAYGTFEYDETAEGQGTTLHDRGYIWLRWEKGSDGKWRYSHFVATPRVLPVKEFPEYMP